MSQFLHYQQSTAYRCSWVRSVYSSRHRPVASRLYFARLVVVVLVRV